MLALLAGAVSAGGGYRDWAVARFVAAELAGGLAAPRQDPDRDRWPNLLEYLAGTDPRAAASLPTIEFAAGDTLVPEACCTFAGDCSDAGLRVLVSDDLTRWTSAGAAEVVGGRLVVPLGGCRFARLEVFALPGMLLDSDGDGLHDLFEEEILAACPAAAGHIGEVLPGGDHDGDGITNLNEPANQHPGGSGFPRPPVLDPAAVAAAADSVGPAPAPALAVHTPLR